MEGLHGQLTVGKKLKGFMLMDTYKIEITGKEELNRKIKDDDLDKWKDQV